VYLKCGRVDVSFSIGLGGICNDEERRPNAIMKKVIDKDVHLCLFALRNIGPGEDYYDYAPHTGSAMHWRKINVSLLFMLQFVR